MIKQLISLLCHTHPHGFAMDTPRRQPPIDGELMKTLRGHKKKAIITPNSITRKLFNALYNNAEADYELQGYILTEKEICFFNLAATDLTYKEIARDMKISPRAVDKIRGRIFLKLDVKSRVGLAVKTVNEGLVV